MVRKFRVWVQLVWMIPEAREHMLTNTAMLLHELAQELNNTRYFSPHFKAGLQPPGQGPGIIIFLCDCKMADY